MADLSSINCTIRVRKRWWAKLLLAVAPPALALLYRVSPRAALVVLKRVVNMLGPRALIIEVVDSRKSSTSASTA